MTKGITFAATIATAAALSLGAALPASAQGANCAPRVKVLSNLADRYAEQPVSMGVTATGGLLEVLASPDGSWTILITVPGGPTCLVAHGDGWHNLKLEANGPVA